MKPISVKGQRLWESGYRHYTLASFHSCGWRTMVIGLCTIELHLPGLGSLKQKRGVLKPMLTRLHNTFNVSVAEIDQQDVWQSAVVAVAMVTNSTPHAQSVLNNVLDWIEFHYPNVNIVRQQIEIL